MILKTSFLGSPDSHKGAPENTGCLKVGGDWSKDWEGALQKKTHFATLSVYKGQGTLYSVLDLVWWTQALMSAVNPQLT